MRARWIPVRHDVYEVQTHLATYDMEFHGLDGLYRCRAVAEAPCQAWQVKRQCTP